MKLLAAAMAELTSRDARLKPLNRMVEIALKSRNDRRRPLFDARRHCRAKMNLDSRGSTTCCTPSLLVHARVASPASSPLPCASKLLLEVWARSVRAAHLDVAPPVVLVDVSELVLQEAPHRLERSRHEVRVRPLLPHLQVEAQRVDGSLAHVLIARPLHHPQLLVAVPVGAEEDCVVGQLDAFGIEREAVHIAQVHHDG
eukprot:CAMPEP_0170193644 /NCGR_PEP_ID=MMETSP0040_2-20121228/57353_1 /TAXON_ID=641309 /ORGANISM="Lotharella oceanica, Strain CCMP622" /LENGTH=199 /DNA_ID=CAMNT_0010442335 /DNA_START=95 /DNA_END=690 /DNA_ORIENTATION=-